MTEFTLGIAIACGIIGAAALFKFRDRIDSIGRHGIKLRPPPHPNSVSLMPPPQPNSVSLMPPPHPESHTKDQQEIERLTASNAENAKTNARLTASNADKNKEIAALSKQVRELSPKGPLFTGFYDDKPKQ